VEDQVEAFKSARPEVLEFARRPVIRSDSPKRKLDEVEDASIPLQKRTRSGRRIQSNPQVFVLDPPGRDDADYDPGMCEYVSGLQPLSYFSRRRIRRWTGAMPNLRGPHDSPGC
jgi:hypothetical protein